MQQVLSFERKEQLLHHFEKRADELFMIHSRWKRSNADKGYLNMIKTTHNLNITLLRIFGDGKDRRSFL
jgi:hypothetical protein|tara:strand:- start:1564 stop:1770 length:207 start_codon:yes stop_codon:yes gene_type:complete